MTSRPTVGTQPPLPQRTTSTHVGPSRAPVRARSVVHVNTAVGNAGQQPDVIDVTAEGDTARAEETAARTPLVYSNNFSAGTSGAPSAQDVPQAFLARGKPQLYFDDGSIPRTSIPASSASNIPATSTVPFPPRPGFFAEDNLQTRKSVAAGNEPQRGDAAQGQGLEPPAIAIRLPGGKPVDFCPWSGNHQEDVLSEQVVKAGSFDKSQPSNETNTGRPAFWPHFKNKTGLQTLSALFVSVLEKRQALGRLTTSSTFKLPPRVTLTDTKREEWLRDLANPAVSLRRLSRKIPHGIRGKVLLEQCMSKNIPTARAVWLAKCVGANEMANEMRAIKRKGTGINTGAGGELKWIREWTTHVEQFVESTILACGQDGWRERIDYAIRLVTNIYAEHILDEDHYLDWLLSSLESSPLERLPIWLLLVQIYWKDVVSNRRRGRRVAEGLLSQLQAASSDSNGETCKPLIHRLHQYLTNLVVRHRGCMIIPRSWDRFESILVRAFAKVTDPVVTAAVRNLVARNQRIASAGRRNPQKSKTPCREVVDLLDSVQLDFDIKHLSSKCLSLITDPEELIRTVMRWASSLYREGSHRTYLAVRLLRIWNIKGIDTDGAILAFLASLNTDIGVRHHDVCKVIAELALSKHFSASRYLQWLIATGALVDCKSIHETSACHVRLLVEIPEHSLPAHVSHLRQTLLQSLGWTVDNHDRRKSEARNMVKKQLGDFLGSEELSDAEGQPSLSQLDLSVKADISRWMRQEVASRALPQTPTSKEQSEEYEGSPLTASQFFTIRDILTQLGDFPILADILKIAVGSPNPLILAAVSDTLNYHRETFAAIGALNPLLQCLLDRYTLLRPQRPPDRLLCASLADLCRSVQGGRRMMQLLMYDIARYDQRDAVAACSPASDNMAEISSDTKIDSDEEVERILASGTSMDEQMQTRVFQRVVTRLSEARNEDADYGGKFGAWFQRLRKFDEKHFDGLVSEWLSRVLLKADEVSLSRALPNLTGTGCMSPRSLLTALEKSITTIGSKDTATNGRMATLVLERLVSDTVLSNFCQIQDAYRYCLELRRFCEGSEDEILNLTQLILQTYSSDCSQELKDRILDLLRNERFLSVLRRYAISGSRVIERLVSVFRQQSLRDTEAASILADDLLDPVGALGTSPEEQVKRVVEMADELSLPFCQIKLGQLLSAGRGTEVAVERVFFDSIKLAIDDDRPIWTGLVIGLDTGIAQKVRQHAEIQILSAPMDFGKEANTTHVENSERGVRSMTENTLERYLDVVDLTASSISPKGQPQLSAVLHDKFKMLIELLSSPTDQGVKLAVESKEDTVAGGSDVQAVVPWIHALLHLSTVHRQSFYGGKTTPTDYTSFMSVLCSLLSQPELRPFPSTTEYIFDVLAHLSDDLPTETLTHLSRLEAPKSHHDSRITFLFGSTASPESWLGIVTSHPQPTFSSSSNQPTNPQFRSATQQPPTRPQQQQPPVQAKWPAPRNPQGTLPPTSHPQTQQAQTQAQQTRSDARPVPFPPRRWEILPEAGSNDTALSLTLFGARRVT